MRPTGLITTRKPGEILALGHMIHNRHFLGHADRIACRRDITDGPDTGVLHMLGPHGIDDPRTGRQLIAFGMEMMLNGADAPNAKVIGGFDDVDHFVQHSVVKFGIPSDRPLRSAVRLVHGRQYRIHVHNDFRLRHVLLP